MKGGGDIVSILMWPEGRVRVRGGRTKARRAGQGPVVEHKKMAIFIFYIPFL